MQLRNTFIGALILVGAVSAQTPDDELKSKMEPVRYPNLAEAARVQGDVHIHINAGVVTVLSGPPLLVQSAVESAKVLGSIRSETNLDVTYHFVFIDTTTSARESITVPRGNAMERIVLRMFGLKTGRVVERYSCHEGVPPLNDLTITGTTIQIWVYGKTYCMETESTLAGNFGEGSLTALGSFQGGRSAERTL